MQVRPVLKKKLDALIRAKDARNYFAHHAALPVLVYRPTNAVSRELERVTREAFALALGDNICAGWVYAIEEKEPPSRLMMMARQERVARWILGEFMALEDPG